MPLPEPPSPFPDCRIISMESGQPLYRVHSTHRGGNVFNPHDYKQRFSPIYDISNKIIPSLYVATSFEAAIFESIFHEIQPCNFPRTIPKQQIDGKSLTVLRPQRNLAVVSLYSHDIMAWRLARTDLIDTPESDYERTAQWAAAIHRAMPNADGLIWVSKRYDTEKCIVLFEDRIRSDDLMIANTSAFRDNPKILLEIFELGRQADIRFT